MWERAGAYVVFVPFLLMAKPWFACGTTRNCTGNAGVRGTYEKMKKPRNADLRAVEGDPSMQRISSPSQAMCMWSRGSICCVHVVCVRGWKRNECINV